MGFLSNLFKRKKKPVSRFQQIKHSFKKRWYNKELDSLLNTKQNTPVERMLRQIVSYHVDIVSAIISSSNDITILSYPIDNSQNIYNCVYELNKIFSLKKNCENDVFNLCINLSKVSIMICNNLEDINSKHVLELQIKLNDILEILGDSNIIRIYDNTDSYNRHTLELLVTHFYSIYKLLYIINQDIVYNNKVYRNQLKSMSQIDSFDK